MMMVQDKAKAGLASFMKSRLVARIMCSIGNCLSRLRTSRKSKIKRVTTSAVNKLAATPIVSVTPNPLMGPLPMKINIMDEMRVVTWESKMVPKARS